MPFVAAFLAVPDTIMRAMFARGAFTKADAAAAGATLAAYAIGLIPFVLIRSAVATFYARKDTATPVKAALTGVAVNVALKVALVGSLAQIGLALATAVGAWVNLLLVHLALRCAPAIIDARPQPAGLVLLKFAVCRADAGRGAVVHGAICRHRRCCRSSRSATEELTLALLIVVGAVDLCGVAILVLFGRRWLISLVR